MFFNLYLIVFNFKIVIGMYVDIILFLYILTFTNHTALGQINL